MRAEPDVCAAASLPKSCDVLDEQLAPGDNCDSKKRCDVVLDEPDQLRVFSFALWEFDPDTGESIDQDLVADRKACVEAWLDALDLEYFSADRNSTFVVETSYSDIGPLLEWSAITKYSVECTENGCRHCDDLDESACSEDPFCSVEEGAAYNGTYACWSEPRFAACLRGSAFCDDGAGTARGPYGNCWAFPSLCYAEEFDYSDDECAELATESSCE